jgi:CDP-diglyceride synthetase
MSQPESPRFYFALPRLLAHWRGGNSTRAEKNSVEAWAGNLAIFGITYLYFARFIPDGTTWWLSGLMFVALAFLVWLFWLLMLYLNSLILKLLRGIGLLRSLPARRGQGILIVATTAAMALALVQNGSFAGEIAALWLTAIAMNLIAAGILAFSNGKAARL